MLSEQRLLPLFPLNTVLFPSASLPLQIFEERYKLMMQHCLDSDSKFGIVLIKSGAEVGGPAVPFSMGTVAHIAVVNRVEDGRMFISVTGQQRFQIQNITQYRPYMAAEVKLLAEESDVQLPPAEMAALLEAVARHLRLAVGLRGGWLREPRASADPSSLSYFIAEILPVGLAEKQALLEEPSTTRRLDLELPLLKQVDEVLQKRVSLELRRRFSYQ